MRGSYSFKGYRMTSNEDSQGPCRTLFFIFVLFGFISHCTRRSKGKKKKTILVLECKTYLWLKKSKQKQLLDIYPTDQKFWISKIWFNLLLFCSGNKLFLISKDALNCVNNKEMYNVTKYISNFWTFYSSKNPEKSITAWAPKQNVSFFLPLQEYCFYIY